ncbi:methylmalonyl-CoA epimerase [Anoxybacillus thermarum]|uniref:Methylmalonyl-CoA epimerase n=1 Tax=Anoxybacillus thermarum TaxID=404937 RepID=A0A0D0Q587_9BACL|nr:methylmalonyl-CoA epimerase [Anoxybacillus thermarum]
MEVKKVDHIGIAVKSLDEALPFYTDTLGLSCIGIETVESEQVRVAFLKVGDVKLELLEESVKTLWRTFFRFTTGVVNH